MLYALALASLGLVLPAAPAAAQAGAVRGAAYSAIGRTNDITDVQVVSEDDGATRIVITGTRPFRPEVSTYQSNTIVAVPGVWRAGRTGVRPVRKNGVASVNCVQFADKPQRIVRVVASTQEKVKATIEPTDSPCVWGVVLRKDSPAVSDDSIVVDEAAQSIPVTVVKASAPQNLAPTELRVWTESLSSLTSSAPIDGGIWGEIDFSPRVRPVTATLSSLEPSVRPSGLILALPQSLGLSLAQSLGMAESAEPSPSPKGSGSLAPVVVAMPLAPGALPRLAAAPEPTKPLPLDRKPEVKAAKPQPVAASAKPEPTAPKSRRPETPVAVDKALVTLDLVDTDIVSVLKAIQQQSGYNIVVSQQVTGKVTVSLKRVTVLDALNQIARINKFRYALVDQTFFVGSAADIQAATAKPLVGEIVSSSIQFFYANAEDLKKSVEQAFPNVTLSLINVSSESKSVQTDASSTATPGAAPLNQTVKLTPRGGVINIVGTLEEIKSVRDFIDATEAMLIKSSLEDARIKNEVARGNEVEVYRVHNSDPDSLIGLMHTLAPSVSFLVGPTPNFVGMPTGASSAFSSSGSGGAGASSGGGGSSSGGSSGAIKSSILILTGPPDDVKVALEKIQKIDVRSPLIVFEAKLIEVNSGDTDKLGITYDLSRSVAIGEVNGGDAPSVGGGGTVGRLLGGGAIWRTPYSINAQINALVQGNKARILTSPTLTAMDNNPAGVFIGDQIKYVSNIQQTPTGQTVTTEQVEAGIRLKVLGRVRPDGEIELMVHPEVSLIKNFIQLPGGVSLPQIATRFVDTMVRIKDGETIAIGGLLSEQDTVNMQKLPGLGDLPFFGKLFQNKEKTKTRTELMVFITSRIVKD